MRTSIPKRRPTGMDQLRSDMLTSIISTLDSDSRRRVAKGESEGFGRKGDLPQRRGLPPLRQKAQAGTTRAETGQDPSLRERCEHDFMRVIAGQYRRRTLRSLPGLEIRPTADRMRETLFNVPSAGDPAALAGSTWLRFFGGGGRGGS